MAGPYLYTFAVGIWGSTRAWEVGELAVGARAHEEGAIHIGVGDGTVRSGDVDVVGGYHRRRQFQHAPYARAVSRAQRRLRAATATKLIAIRENITFLLFTVYPLRERTYREE